MKKLFLILFACLPAFAQTSISPLTLRVTDFPQSSPVDTVQLFVRNYAATDGLAGLVGRMETSGFFGIFPTTDSFARMSLGHIQPLTTLDIRGTPQVNSGLFYMNDQHTFTGSSGTGPGWFAAVGQQLAFSIKMNDTIEPDNSYDVDIEGLPGVINGTSTRNLRFGVVGTNTTYYPLTINHTGFVSIGPGNGGNGTLVAVDGNVVIQGDTNAAGLGGQVSLEPSPTKPIVLSGGLKHNFRSASATTTVATNDYFLLATSSINVTNMDASDVLAGRVIWIGGDTGDTATVIPQAGDTINGAASYTITSGWAGLTSDGVSNWQVFGVTSSGTAGYDTIEEEGTPLTQRTTLNFVGSTGTAADAGGKTVLTFDADVDALASNSSNGLWARTGSGTGAARTITAGTGISIADGNGVGGNPTITYTGSAVFQIPTITKALTDSSPTDIFEVDLAAGERCNFIVKIGIEVSDGTDFQAYTAVVKVAAVNKAGTITVDKRLGSDNTAFAPSDIVSNLIVTYPDSSDADSFLFQVDATTTLMGATLTMRYAVESLTTTTITPL